MQRFEQDTAQKIFNAIKDGKKTMEKFVHYLEEEARCREFGTARGQQRITHFVPESIVNKILKIAPQVNGSNLYNDENQHQIDLRSLAAAFPDEIVKAFLPLTLEERAAKAKIPVESAKNFIKSQLITVTGTPGKSDFTIILKRDVNLLKQVNSILGLDTYKIPAGYGSIIPINKKKYNYDEVYVLPAHHYPMAVAYVAQAVNFPGATYYIPKQL